MKKEKNAYITPLLTVVEFRTEKGYAYSFASTVDAMGNHVEMQVQGVVDQMTMETQAITDPNSFVAGYMDGEYDDNSIAVGDWTYQNGSHF